MCVRWAAPPQREIVFNPSVTPCPLSECWSIFCCRLRVSQIIWDSVYDTLCLDIDFWLPLDCTFAILIPVIRPYSDWPFSCLLSRIVYDSDSLAFDHFATNKRLRLCLTLVCVWFLEWYVTLPACAGGFFCTHWTSAVAHPLHSLTCSVLRDAVLHTTVERMNGYVSYCWPFSSDITLIWHSQEISF